MKNLVLFHLESLNNVIFKMHPDCFPKLRCFIEEATYYSNYYSTATSTYMTITDLFYGSTMQFEKSSYLEDIFSVKSQKISIFDWLKDRGYETKCYCFGDQEGTEAKKYANVFCGGAAFWESLNDKNCMLRDVETVFSKKEPFAVFFMDSESHWMNTQMYTEKLEKKAIPEIFNYKYKMLDETFGMVIESLKKSGQYDETVVVAYGDHGDEFFGHGLHDGYTHAIEPFPFMVNCPLIVRNAQIRETGNVISTVDVYDIIKSSLYGRLCECGRKFAFSRNLFSRQGVSKKSFNKSYMVTDGRYSLMVSQQGLSLYWCQADVYNGRNLLDFFKLTNKKICYKEIYHNLKGSHYKYIMNEIEQEIIVDEVRVLKKKLQDFIRVIYEGEVDELKFDKINYSHDVCDLELKIRLYIRKSIKKTIHVMNNIVCINSLKNSRVYKILYELYG